MTDSFYAMTIGISHERAKIVGVVDCAKSWCAIVTTAFAQRRGVKVHHGLPVDRAKAQMHATSWFDVPLHRDRELDPEGR